MVETAIFAINSGIGIDEIAVKEGPVVDGAGVKNVEKLVAIFKSAGFDILRSARDRDGFQCGAARKRISADIPDGIGNIQASQGDTVCKCVRTDILQCVGQMDCGDFIAGCEAPVGQVQHRFTADLTGNGQLAAAGIQGFIEIEFSVMDGKPGSIGLYGRSGSSGGKEQQHAEGGQEHENQDRHPMGTLFGGRDHNISRFGVQIGAAADAETVIFTAGIIAVGTEHGFHLTWSS